MSSFGGTVKLTGESEYKKALKEISTNLRVLDSEMKAVTSAYDKNDTSAENLAAQSDVLSKKVAEQERKVALLSEALAKAQEETGESSETTKKWQIELNNAQAELNKLTRQAETNEDAIRKAKEVTFQEAEALEEVGNEAEDSGKEVLSLGDIIKANLISDAIKGGLEGIANGIKAIGAGFGQLINLGTETKETQTAMAKLDASFDSAGLGAENAQKTVTGLYGVLGDTDRAVEASNLLAKMSTSEADLEANSRILTGVFAEFGDSIPTEGLAEGMQATAKMGSVQGVLADALEWSGVNLDEYNLTLESMTTEAERSAYIQQTLTDIYGESADAYRANNEALIASNEATLRNEQVMAKLGQTTLPITTNITNMKSALLEGFTPALSSVMGGVNNLTGAFSDLLTAVISGEGVDQAFYMVSEGLTDLIVGIEESAPLLRDMVTRLLDMALNLITEYIPWMLEEGASMLSSLLSGISTNLSSIFPVILSVFQTLTSTILQNLPMILQMGIEVLVSLIQGISSMLPELIPLCIDTIILLAETLLDNIDLIIDAGIGLVMALAEGLVDSGALIRLIDKIPVIFDKLILTISENLPLLIDMGIELTLKLAAGLIKAIPQLVSKIPQIIESLVKGLNSGFGKMGEIGLNLVQGLWNGIKNATSWIMDKIKGFGQSVLNGLKSFFGIHSPSTVFKDEIGQNLALGVGEGFADTMEDVSNEMQSAIPTEFDTNISTNMNMASGHTQMSNYDMMVSAFKKALTEVKVVMNDREMGGFVTDVVERTVFA